MADNIVFSSTPGQSLKSFLDDHQYSTIVVLVDQNTRQHCYPALADALPEHSLVDVPAGEEHKNLETCSTIWKAFTDLQLDRHAVVIVLGGGVLGDMGGFCAATYKRGIDFILVPTTLLAQVDSSIGGKLGVDFNHLKNHIGTFQFPVLNLVSPTFLSTLPEAELKSGFAEIIKHILTSDKSMWEVIRKTPFGKLDWDELIRHSVSFKTTVAHDDPKEKGKRKILNAGHTIGHAIESHLLSVGRKVLHGEAVAAGLVAECFLAAERRLITAAELLEIQRYILNGFGKLTWDEDESTAIASLTLQDKKNKGKKILAVLLNGIGDALWDQEISERDVLNALAFYRAMV